MSRGNSKKRRRQSGETARTRAVLGGVGVVLAFAALQTPDAPSDAGSVAAAPGGAEPVSDNLAVPRPAEGPLRLLFAGDSLTAGSYATAEANTFRSLVAAELGAGGQVEVSVVGRAGQPVTDAVNTSAPTAADVVVVEYGTNDVQMTDVGGFASAYGQYLDQVREVAPDAALVCVGSWSPKTESGPFDQAMLSLCQDHGGKYTDITAIYNDRAKFRAVPGTAWYGGTVPDDAHPNDDGHAAIARAITSRFDL
jgi:acyl-CoA thioesterase-1